MKFLKIIESSILCLRFPFLYPRNRFSDLHYTNWKMFNFVGNWKSQTYDIIWFHPTTEKKGGPMVTQRINDFREYTILVKDNKVSIRNKKKIIWEKPFSYFGEGEIKGITRNSDNKLCLSVSEDFKRNESNQWLITIIHSKWLYKICNIVDWIHEHPVQWLHFIPTFTELDAMETGWRNAFGIQMCKEIKTALKKNNCLRKYRITQIKEKYGSLRWYDTGAPEEVHKIISKYEQISAKTCIICGKSAKYISKGWISPYCENCIGNRNYTKIGEENYDEMV